MIQLKSKKKDDKGWPAAYGFLIKPEPDDSIVDDESLLSAIRKEGRAVVCTYKDALYTPGLVATLTPDEFEEQWRGD